MFQRIEEKYNVIYPENPNATYESILNYSLEKDNPFQRWYRYKEGFSIQFVQRVIEQYRNKNTRRILDPFVGSGTTILAANQMGMTGLGFEVNPFSFFLMKVKQYPYSLQDILCFKDESARIFRELEARDYESYKLPELSIADQVFQKDSERLIMSCREKIKKVKNSQIKDLLLLGWLSCVEELSNYRKAGNGLKKRKTVKPFIVSEQEAIDRITRQYQEMSEDLSLEKKVFQGQNQIFNYSSLGFASKLGPESVDGIIFSPPYANCFDYTEIYKLELWFGEFVSSYDDLKLLRAASLKSHLNKKYNYQCLESQDSEILNEQLRIIGKTEVWDKRIPQMLFGYFEDMFNILRNCYQALTKGGFCAIVVGNSAYSNVVVPTDLILAEYANRIGFCVDKIEVNRFIITSSQQYEKTKTNGKYLRESVVCLVKK